MTLPLTLTVHVDEEGRVAVLHQGWSEPRSGTRYPHRLALYESLTCGEALDVVAALLELAGDELPL